MNSRKAIPKIYVICLILLSLTTIQSQALNLPEKFNNVIELNFYPDSLKHWPTNLFMDMGSWYGFANPKKTETISFTGPFSIYHKKWISKSLLNLNISVNKTEIQYGEKNLINSITTPGKLQQKYTDTQIEVSSELIFVSSKSALVRYQFRNNSNSKISLSLNFNGEIVFPEAEVSQKSGNLFISSNNKKIYSVKFPSDISITTELNSYQAKTKKPFLISSGAEKTIYVWLDGYYDDQAVIVHTDNNPGKHFYDNNKRWNNYLDQILKSNSAYSKNTEYSKIAIKSIMTLINNWKCKTNDLLYDGIIPSFAVWYFDGFWAWDSWKHAVGIVRFEPQLAKNQIKTMFAYQLGNGMIPDVIYLDKKDNNLRDTKPPLAAWSVLEVYNKTKDKKFVKELFPKLQKYHSWWYTDRDYNNNKLCEYGSVDGTAEAALWESGMDDAVRYDSINMIKNSDSAFSMDQESVDLNAYLYQEKICLSKLADILGYKELQKSYINEATELKSVINKYFYCKDRKFYFDFNLSSNKLNADWGPEGWIPLYCKIAENDQALNVKEYMMNPSKFNTYIPLPTVSADNKSFMTGYWRGPVWLDQVYFGIKGLSLYEYKNEAAILTKKIFDNCEGLKADKPIFENYDARNGKGLKAKHFSWSAVSLLQMYFEE